MQEVEHEAVRAAWQRVVESWDDAARHDAFVGLVAQHNCFAWAAARYKERAGDAVADRQLERLRRAATATMLATATVREEHQRQPYRSTLIALIAMLLLAVIGLVCTKMVADNQPTRTTPRAP
jgi:hypothetical protein